MHLKIEARFPIVKKKVGAYHAFPTIIRQTDQLWLACRSGRVSGRQDHGDRGKVLLFSTDVGQPDNWSPFGTLFEPALTQSVNELDAILSAPASDLIFLATRDYEFTRRNDVYLSRGSSPALTRRRLLTTISDQKAICFGHIRLAKSGDLLMSGYCGFEDEPAGTPVLLASADRGKTWTFRAKVASSAAVGTRLTEYSLGYLGNRNWVVLMRNETPPFDLYRCQSSDDGRTWSVPVKTTLFGHAPMILDSQTIGGHLVIYRDLSETDPGVAIGMSQDQGRSWRRMARLAAYTGSIYDGGYGDVVQLNDTRYMAVYYLCDADASPWIEGCIFSIQ